MMANKMTLFQTPAQGLPGPGPLPKMRPTFCFDYLCGS